jgi:hypothetical protein
MLILAYDSYFLIFFKDSSDSCQKIAIQEKILLCLQSFMPLLIQYYTNDRYLDHSDCMTPNCVLCMCDSNFNRLQ